MLRYNNVAGPGPQGGDQSFWAWECECECGEQVTVLAFFPGRARREQGGAPTFGAGTCVWLSLLPWGAATAGAPRAPPPPLGLPAAVSQAPVPFGGGMCGLAEERVHWKESITAC